MFNQSNTEEIKKNLAEYYDENFYKYEYGCSHYDDDCSKNMRCNSFRDSTRIGKLYDTYWNDSNDIIRPLKTMIIGLEGVSKNTFSDKNKSDFRVEGKANFHIWDTLETLQMIYKVFNADSDSPWVENPWFNKYEIHRNIHHNGISDECLYDHYALGNLFKCVFKEYPTTDNKNGVKNDNMYTYCPKHIIEEIKILKPTIVIYQYNEGSDTMLKAIKNEFNWKVSAAPDVPAIKKDGSFHEKRGLYCINTKDKDWGNFYFIMSLNPAYRGPWKKSYVKNTLKPAIQYLEEIGVVPSKCMNDAFSISRNKKFYNLDSNEN